MMKLRVNEFLRVANGLKNILSANVAFGTRRSANETSNVDHEKRSKIVRTFTNQEGKLSVDDIRTAIDRIELADAPATAVINQLAQSVKNSKEASLLRPIE